MSLPRRLTAVLMSLLLLQLMLPGSGAFCTMSGDSGHAMAGMTGAPAMAGMAHETAAPTQPARTHGETAVVASADDQQGGDDCHQPWASGTCVSMASCLVGVTALPSRTIETVGVPASVAETREPAAARAGPTFAPEIPPPRA